MTLPHLPEFVTLSDPVAQALAHRAPVVALESTIITHGMPFPDNVEMAKSVETIVEETGATPATIAVLDGVLKIGLSDADLDKLAKSQDVMKISRADLAFAVARKKTAGTTVAATMMAADLAGIDVFATGGIGGVHKGAETSFDISADLTELGRTATIVVCAGAKAILDIPKTLEVLETQGVPVVGFGTDTLPAFWSAHSQYSAPLRLDTAGEVARFQQVRGQVGDTSGILIANPIPAPDEIPQDVISTYIDAAQADVDAQAIKGKDVTPFLLQRIFELSQGTSLKANISLVQNNARVAAEIAVALAALR